MKVNPTARHRHPAFTLVEMTIVILVLLTLVGVSFFVTSRITDWRLGRTAAEALRSVYTAQRMYLADHPTQPVDSLTLDDLIPYLPGGTPLPEVRSLDDQVLTFIVNRPVPRLALGATPYDPSGSLTDGIWDLGLEEDPEPTPAE